MATVLTKNQKKTDKVVWMIVLLPAVIYLFYALGTALVDCAEIKGAQLLVDTLDRFEVRLLQPFENISNYIKHETVHKTMLCGFGVWALIAAYVLTDNRTYLAGNKYYGTARWGEQKDIKDLFAENIKKAEIRKARKMIFPWVRWSEYRRTIRLCKDQAAITTKVMIEALKMAEVKDKVNGTYSRKKYQQQMAAIRADEKERCRDLFAYNWEPKAIQQRYTEELQRIDEVLAQGLLITTEQAEEQRKAAKQKRKEDLRAFWSVRRREAKITVKYQDADILLTETERICMYNWKVNGHVLVVGSSGAGKSRGFSIPQILQANASGVVLDPKGELLEKTGYFLTKIKGFKVRVLNLYDKPSSDGYNPFVYIHPERRGYEERVMTLVETIILNTDGGEKRQASDPFWEKAERLFLQALFYFVCDGFVPEERNMNTVMKLIAMLQIDEENDQYNSDLDYFARIFEARLNEADKEHHNAGTKHIGVRLYKEFRSKAAGRTAKSIVISAVARLGPFQSSETQRIFSYDSMELDRIGEEKMMIFLVTPPTDHSFDFIAGMVVTQLFQEIQYCATVVHKHHGQRLPIPVRFHLDEFANCFRIPNFISLLAYARSFGVGICPIIQSIDQLKAMFKDEWGVVIDNCNSLLYLGGIKHEDTLKYISSLCGKTTYDKKTFSRSKGKQGSVSWNNDYIGVELMNPDQISNMPKDECLLFIIGRPAFHSKKLDFSRHPNYLLTSDGNSKYQFDYVPQLSPWEKDREVPHGEDEIRNAATERVQATIERVNRDVKSIEVRTGFAEIINHVSRAWPHMAIVSNDALIVPDGEDAAVDLAAVLGHENDERLDALLAERSDHVSDTMQRIDSEVAADGVEIITDPAAVAKTVIETVTHFAPVEDATVEVDHGELPADGYIMDEEYDLPPQEFGDLSSELDRLMAAMIQENSGEAAENFGG